MTGEKIEKPLSKIIYSVTVISIYRDYTEFLHRKHFRPIPVNMHPQFSTNK